jgi:L-ribulokinase
MKKCRAARKPAVWQHIIVGEMEIEMSKYSVGVDFGTLSARAMIVDNENGRSMSVSEYKYTHGVMRNALPCGTLLCQNWALQHPKDYLKAISFTVHDAIKKCEVAIADITGIGIDFTSCTILPVKSDGTPLCMIPEYDNERHAYVKLWQHHAAQYCADILNRQARLEGVEWLEPLRRTDFK